MAGVYNMILIGKKPSSDYMRYRFGQKYCASVWCMPECALQAIWRTIIFQ